MTLYLLYTALPYLIMLGIGLMLPLLIVLCYSRYGFGLLAIAGMFLFEASVFYVGGFYIGIRLYYTDFVLVIIGCAAGLRLFFAADFPLRHWAWILVCLSICLSLVLGLASFGSTAGVSAREYFYFMVAGLYGMSFVMDEKRIRFTLDVFVALAAILMLVTAFRWVVYYTPITSLLPPDGVYNIDGAIRVIKSNEALVLAQILIAGIFFSTASRGLGIAQWLSPLLLGLVLALQHRSVWLAMLIGGLARFLIVRSRAASATSQLILVGAIIGITLTPMIFSDRFSGLTDQVQSSAERALEGTDTTGERLSNWKSLIQLWYEGGPKSILIGQSFGTDSTRYVDKDEGGVAEINYYAHNLYVQTLYNTGLVGLFALLWIFAYVIRGLYLLNRDGQGGVTTQALLVLMLMQVAYYVPYGTDYLQSVLFGVCLSYVATRSSAKAQPLAYGGIALRQT